MTRLSAIWDLPFDRAVNIYTLHPDFSGYTSKWNSGDGTSHSSMWDNLSKLFLFIACFPSWRKPKLFTDNEGRSFFFFRPLKFLKHDRLLSIDFLWFEKCYNYQRQYWEKSIETPPLLLAPWNEAENF